MLKHETMSRVLPVIAFAACVLTGCLNVHMTVDPVEVNVHGTLDVNVKVDRALDDFFGDLDQKSTTIKPTAPVSK